MGATHSKSEPIIFYNHNVPLQFTQGFVDSLETRQKPAVREENIEAIVRERVAEELRRREKDQGQRDRRSFSDIAKKNIDNDHNSVALTSDIDALIQRVQRPKSKEIPADIAERQEALIACYRKNQNRALDCWKEVEQFKESVAKAQQIFIASHQA